MEEENDLKELVNDCLEQICSTLEFSAYVNLGQKFIIEEEDQTGIHTGRRFYDAERHRKAFLTMKLDYEALFWDGSTVGTEEPQKLDDAPGLE